MIKASISEKENKKYYNKIILSINNIKKTNIEFKAEINFIEMAKFILDNQERKINISYLTEYFKEEDKNILFVGIRKNKY